MEWWLVLGIIIGALLFLMGTGLPVVFCFWVINIAGVYFYWGGNIGFSQLILNMFSSVTLFSLLPVVMFILIGEVLFNSGVFVKSVDVLDKWMGRMPGRLGVLAVGAASLFSCMSGSSIGTTAMLGSMLLPEMERRGYKKVISIGSCMSGALDMIIPPSALGVILASLAEISVAKLLISGVFPGFLMASFYVLYIILRCKLQPSIAPVYVPVAIPWSQRIMDTIKYVLPFGAIIFIVIGLLLLGIADPTEASAMGALAVFILVASYGNLNWEVVKKSTVGTLHTCVMMFMILTGSYAFSQILAISGATQGLMEFVVNLKLSPMMLLIAMQFIFLILGCLIDQVSIMMITFPIFLPLVRSLGFDMVWFGLLTLINMEIGMKSPPFGFCLFVMKGVAPPDTTMMDIYRATYPFIMIDIVSMIVILVFPAIATWLPSLM